jgi:hypothetical protein
MPSREPPTVIHLEPRESSSHTMPVTLLMPRRLHRLMQGFQPAARQSCFMVRGHICILGTYVLQKLQNNLGGYVDQVL